MNHVFKYPDSQEKKKMTNEKVEEICKIKDTFAGVCPLLKQHINHQHARTLDIMQVMKKKKKYTQLMITMYGKMIQ